MLLEEYLKIYPKANNKAFIKKIEKCGIDVIYCKCGNIRPFREKRMSWFCSKECNPAFNRKRPEHSKFMKENHRDISSCFKKGRSNTFVNSIDWKIKVLKNGGLITQEADFNTNKITEIFSKYLSDRIKSIPYKKRIIKRILSNDNYNKHPNFHGLTKDDIDIMLEDDVEKLMYTYNSIKTLNNRTDKCGARSFKREMITNLIYNMRVTAVYAKSSYESNYIRAFEKNKILWEYEPIRIQAGNGHYTPDFLFIHNNKKYLLEVKGYFTSNEQKEKYFNTKLKYAIEYCDNNNIVFLFTFNPTFSNINNLIKETINVNY